jgi:hypothetical protein
LYFEVRRQPDPKALSPMPAKERVSPFEARKAVVADSVPPAAPVTVLSNDLSVERTHGI